MDEENKIDNELFNSEDEGLEKIIRENAERLQRDIEKIEKETENLDGEKKEFVYETVGINEEDIRKIVESRTSTRIEEMKNRLNNFLENNISINKDNEFIEDER